MTWQWNRSDDEGKELIARRRLTGVDPSSITCTDVSNNGTLAMGTGQGELIQWYISFRKPEDGKESKTKFQRQRSQSYSQLRVHMEIEPETEQMNFKQRARAMSLMNGLREGYLAKTLTKTMASTEQQLQIGRNVTKGGGGILGKLFGSSVRTIKRSVSSTCIFFGNTAPSLSPSPYHHHHHSTAD